MKNITIILCLALLTSCSVFKKVNKTENKTDVKTETTTTETTRITETETQTADTVIHEAGTEVSGTKPVQELVEGDSLCAENDQVKSTVTYDKVTGKLKLTALVKPHNIPVKINIGKTRITETHTNTTTKKKDTLVAKSVNRKIWNVPFAWLLLLLIALAVVYYYRKKIPVIGKFFG
jgi:hypothetical protein